MAQRHSETTSETIDDDGKHWYTHEIHDTVEQNGLKITRITRTMTWCEIVDPSVPGVHARRDAAIRGQAIARDGAVIMKERSEPAVVVIAPEQPRPNRAKALALLGR